MVGNVAWSTLDDQREVLIHTLIGKGTALMQKTVEVEYKVTPSENHDTELSKVIRTYITNRYVCYTLT
jgi:hypothetical protein